jgi:hypothetical protein
MGGLLAGRLLRGQTFNLLNASFVVGATAMLALFGIAFGVWSAKRQEAKRKAREDILLKH